MPGTDLFSARVCKDPASFILFQTLERMWNSKGRAEEVWAAVARSARCFVYPVCIIWDYACQGTVNKDSVHLLHAVLDPLAKSISE